MVLDRSGRVDPSRLKMSEPIILRDADLLEAMRALYRRGITSVLVEGGPTVLQSFIDSGLWDAARVETAPFALGPQGRAKAPALPAAPSESSIIDGNRIDTYRR